MVSPFPIIPQFSSLSVNDCMFANPIIGTFASLKNVKKDVMEMRKGTECGIGFEDWADFQIGDLIQCYEVIETKRHL